MFPLLSEFVDFTHNAAAAITTEELNAGGIEVYNLPPGTDVPATDVANHTCKHEAGHAYLRRLERSTGTPRTVYIEAFRLRFGYPVDYAVTNYSAGYSSLGEAWAEVFCNACEGAVVTSKSHLDEQVDPLVARTWFLGLAGVNPPTLPPPQKAPLMYDSTNAADIPADAPIVAGYIDGAYVWNDVDWARFPNAAKVTISIFGNDADVLDIENGAATPGMAPDWTHRQWARGAWPTVYVNLANVAAVRRAVDAAGVPQPDYWLAHYDNDPTIPEGYVSKQYANEPLTGGHFDVSSVVAGWPRGGDDLTPEQDTRLRNVEAMIASLQQQQTSLVATSLPTWLQRMFFALNPITGKRQGKELTPPNLEVP